MLTLVALLVLSACTSTSVSGPDPAGSADSTMRQDAASEVQLAVGASTRTDEVTVTFVGVTDDSRCPKGVTCVWEGDALVALAVRGDGGAADERVTLHANSRFTQEATLAGVRVRLVRLDPYPEADRAIAPGDYRVVLSITTA